MQDPDDLFTDDIVFDDQTLALLDAQEQKFASQSFGAAPTTLNSPPSKRRKITHSNDTRRSDANPLEDWEDLPEISIRSDGTYGFHDSEATSTPRPLTKTQPNVPAIACVQPQHVQSTARTAMVPGRMAPPVPPPATRVRPASSQSRPFSDHRQNSRLAIQHVHSSRNSQNHSVASRRPSVNGGTRSQEEATQTEELRQQIEELRNANQKLLLDFQAATDIRYAKEGEVTILRKGIEKTARDHADRVAKLKKAKEEADEKQLQIQKEMKEEMERLRTQFTFKQHELETSHNKGSWSVQSRKINRDLPYTPSIVQSQLYNWKRSDTGDPGPSKAPVFPPLLRFGMAGKETSNKRHHRMQVDLEDTKPEMLPGFQNSFMPPSPDIKRLDKGKAKEIDRTLTRTDPYFPVSEFQPPANSYFPQSTPKSPSLMRRLAGSPSKTLATGMIEDSAGGDLDVLLADTQSQLFEDPEQSQPYNWKAEPRQIILTHSYPSYVSPTLQILMSAIPSLTTEVDAYRAACGSVLDVLSSTSRSYDMEFAICESLLSVAFILIANHSIFPLTALLSLLSYLALCLPSFCLSLLSEPQDVPASQSIPKLVGLLSNIVQNHLTPPKSSDDDYAADIRELGKETLSLLDVLCWNIPDEHSNKLSWIPLCHDILPILLDPSQPVWMLSRSARILAILATRTNFHAFLLPLPDTESAQAHMNNKTVIYLEQMSSYLFDAKRHSQDHSLQISALTFVALLSLAHSDALAVLLESATLIPSLVVYLTRLTTPIWEDDEPLMSLPDAVVSTIQSSKQTLLLLHHLVFSGSAVFDLRHKLVHAPHRQFNGITHMFIVTLGRLSYADPPEWVDGTSKLELERLADMARDLLELIVEGPEGDSVWDVYQGREVESEADDEEKEARLLVVDDV